MKVFKQKEDLSMVEISVKYQLYRAIALASIMLLGFICSFILAGFTFKEEQVKREFIIVRDTVEQLVVLKHGLTEVMVDRNKSIPNFCNNPGALRPSSIKEVNDLAIGIVQTKSGKFLHFANCEHGFKALEIVLKKVYWNNTIEECISKYAPSFQNNTDGYIQKIVDKLGCTRESKVKDCNIKKLMDVIAEIEGFKL